MKTLCVSWPPLMIVLLQWVADGSPSHSTPVKIENSNQFVPLKTDPKEFKRVQKLVSRVEPPLGVPSVTSPVSLR